MAQDSPIQFRDKVAETHQPFCRVGSPLGLLSPRVFLGRNASMSRLGQEAIVQSERGMAA
eukprot:4776017-Pyramimonas_sp.AAC.1